MKSFIVFCLMILVLMLSACAPAVHAQPDGRIGLADGRAAYVGVGPDGLLGEDVVLFVDSPIVDKTTGQRVRANVYFVESPTIRAPRPEELIHADVDRIVLAIADPDKAMREHRRGAWLVLEAPGYERWEVELVYRITARRTYGNPIQLVRAMVQA